MPARRDVAQLRLLLASRVERCGDGECWPWTGTRSKRGYGATNAFGKHVGAHRLALALHENIAVPDSSVLCLHSCDNPPCCNPNHLSWGTHEQNIADAVARNRYPNQRKTTCKHGHALTDENTMRDRNGWRKCKICFDARMAARKFKNFQEQQP